MLVSLSSYRARFNLSHIPEILRMILGNTKWTLDFDHFILSEIFDLADEFESVFTDQEAFTQKCTHLPNHPIHPL